MAKTIDSQREHVIVCGFGRFGRAVVEKLEHSETPLVVVDPDPEVAVECDGRGLLHVAGSALEESVLERAGIERARAVVAATSSDADNVFISLLTREKRPDIQIHARASTREGAHRLRLAGANQVISPHQLGGQRIANALLRPAVVEFLELTAPGSGTEVDLEEVSIGASSDVADLPLAELPERGIRVSIVAIKHGDEPIRLNPSSRDVLHAGDHVIAVGDRDNLERLAAMAAAR